MRLSPRYAIALVAACGLFPVALDSTIVNVGIVPISTALHSSVDSIQWIFLGYLLSNAVVTPLSGYLGNRFGVRRIFLLGVALFTLCSFLCGLAPTLTWLIVLRILQGLGGGLLLPLGMAIALDPFAREERARATAVVGIPVLLAPVVGPIIGGLIIDSLNWQYIFFVNVPIGLLVVLLAWRILPADGRSVGDAPVSGRIDTLGLLLSMAGVALLVYATKLVSQTDPHSRTPLNPQGAIFGWGYAPVWALLALGLVMLAIFSYLELRRVHDPVLDLRLFAGLEFAMANLAIWLASIIVFGALFLMPVFLQAVRLPHLSPLHTGLAMLPMGLATLAGVVLGAALYRLVGARLLVLAGALLLGLGCSLLRSLTPGMDLGALSVPLTLVGVSTTLILVPSQTLALEALSGEALNRATSLVNVTKLLWASIGSAVLVTLYIQRTLAHATPPAAQPGSAVPMTLAARAATSGMVDVFTVLLWCTLPLVLVALLLPGRRKGALAGETISPALPERQATAV